MPEVEWKEGSGVGMRGWGCRWGGHTASRPTCSRFLGWHQGWQIMPNEELKG
jgi:hypothetical protein